MYQRSAGRLGRFGPRRPALWASVEIAFDGELDVVQGPRVLRRQILDDELPDADAALAGEAGEIRHRRAIHPIDLVEVVVAAAGPVVQRDAGAVRMHEL